MKDKTANLCKLDFNPGRLEVSAENYDRGRVSQTVKCSACEPFEFNVNVDLLQLALTSLPADSDLTILANQPETQAVIHAGNPDHFRVLLMPLKVAKPAPKPEPEQDEENDEENEEEDDSE